MRTNFPSSLNNLREFEGFKSNDPNDPGGRTVHGISEHYFPEMYPDGREPTWGEAKAFYLRHGFLPSPIEPLTVMLDLRKVRAR